MIIAMCGLPNSGKSTIVDMLFEGFKPCIIRPSDYIPQNADKLDSKMRKKINIEAWNVGIDAAREVIHEGEVSDIVVLDMCNKDYEPIGSMISFGKKKGHKFFTIYVNRPLSECRKDTTIPKRVFDEYVSRIKLSLPIYKKHSDKLLVINNKGSVGDLEEQINIMRESLCLNTLIQTPTT